MRHVHEWEMVLIGNVPIGAACECGEDTGFEKPAMELDRGAMVKIIDPFGRAVPMLVRSVNLTRTAMGTEAHIELIEPSSRNNVKIPPSMGDYNSQVAANHVVTSKESWRDGWAEKVDSWRDRWAENGGGQIF